MANVKRSFTTFRNDIASNVAVSTSSATPMAIIDKNLNDSINTICNLQGGKLRFLEATRNMTTIADKEGYQIPNAFRKLIDLYVYSGSGSSSDTIYSPEMVYDPTKWKQILQYRLGTASTPYFTYVENQTYKIQPIPSVTGNLIVLRGRLQIRNLSIADYTTGTIVSVPYTTTFTAVVASGATSGTLSGAWGLITGTYQIKFSNGELRTATLTNASTAATWTEATTSAATATITVNGSDGGSIVTGSGTTWTADMAGRYLNITQTTAANGGDGFDYEIASFIDSTHIILTKPYEGTAVSVGTAAYTIGQCSVIPQAYDVAAVYRASALYWQKEGNLDRAKTYWMMYDGGKEAGYSKEYGGLILEMLENEGETEEGSYLPPFGSSSNVVYGSPYYFPFQQASGFN